MSCVSNRHTLRHYSIHDLFTLDDLFRFVTVSLVDNYTARIVHHDTIKRALIVLVMDLDILGMLPMNIGVMIKGSPNLVPNHLLAILVAHRKFRIDNQPSQHVECPRIPGLRDTRAIHLQH